MVGTQPAAPSTTIVSKKPGKDFVEVANVFHIFRFLFCSLSYIANSALFKVFYMFILPRLSLRFLVSNAKLSLLLSITLICPIVNIVVA